MTRISLRPFALILVAALAGCSTLNAPHETAMVRITMAGFVWEKSANAEAGFAAEIKTPDELPFYAEVTLPNPAGQPEVIRSRVEKGDTTIRAKGLPRKGWINGETYSYLLRIYSDPGYSHLLDIATQPSVYQALPKSSSGPPPH